MHVILALKLRTFPILTYWYTLRGICVQQRVNVGFVSSRGRERVQRTRHNTDACWRAVELPRISEWRMWQPIDHIFHSDSC